MSYQSGPVRYGPLAPNLMPRQYTGAGPGYGADAGVGLILVLVVSFLQAVLACGGVLIAAGILRVGTAHRRANYAQGGRGIPPSYRGSGPR